MKKLIRIFRKLANYIFPIQANKFMYRVLMKKKLNIKNPKTFNEKINWLKLYEYPNNKLVIKCADKFAVREYIEEKGMSEYLVKLINSWDNEEEIIWEELPKQFVLKCNHGCGYNIIVEDKDKLNKKEAKRKLKKWLNEDFGLVSGERHYSKMPRKIICEEFLESDIRDYKFFCFNGKPEFFYLSQNVKGDFHNMETDFFNINGEKASFSRTDHKHFNKVPKMPSNLNKMIKIAEKLSEDFDFVRVDLFNVDDKIYFSELTFTPCSGFMPLEPENIDLELGKKIALNRRMKYNEKK